MTRRWGQGHLAGVEGVRADEAAEPLHGAEAAQAVALGQARLARVFQPPLPAVPEPAVLPGYRQRVPGAGALPALLLPGVDLAGRQPLPEALEAFLPAPPAPGLRLGEP